MLFYKWGYSWDQIKLLYTARAKDWADKKQIDYQFLVDLAGAALGSKKPSGAVGLDNGEGIDELTEEKEAELRMSLGDDDFERLYKK